MTGVYADVHWFDENGQNIAIDTIKITNDFSRRRLEYSAKNYQPDDLWLNNTAAEKIKDYILNHSYHKDFTAVVIDKILLKDIFILPETR